MFGRDADTVIGNFNHHFRCGFSGVHPDAAVRRLFFHNGVPGIEQNILKNGKKMMFQTGNHQGGVFHKRLQRNAAPGQAVGISSVQGFNNFNQVDRLAAPVQMKSGIGHDPVGNGDSPLHGCINLP